MNERILKLAVEAGVTGHFAAGTELATPIPLSPEMQKFAELIVRECAEIADNADATREKWQSIGKFVREHFGVEE
jgi:hypothetical protein